MTSNASINLRALVSELIHGDSPQVDTTHQYRVCRVFTVTRVHLQNAMIDESWTQLKSGTISSTCFVVAVVCSTI